MLTTIGIVLLFLAILVFCIAKLLGTFPTGWELFNLVLGAIGLAMTTTGIFQSIAGRPILMATFERGALENKRSLHVTLRNVPIGKKSIWKKLGVQRDSIHSLEVYYQTLEAGSNTIIQPPIRAKIYDDSDSTMKNRVMLPPTLIPGVSIFIADWDERQSSVFLRGDELHAPLQLKSGRYKLEISFVINGESRHAVFGFVVGDKPDNLMWALQNPDRIDYRIR